MKKLSLTIIFLLLSFNSNCSFDKSPLYQEDKIEFGSSEEYKIYSTILNSYNNNYSPVVVLSDSTVYYRISKDINYLKENMPSLSDETINHYQNINEHSIQLKNIPDLKIECHLIQRNEGMSWKTKYPEAISLIHFSRVGFNLKCNQALVYFSDYSGPLSGSGNLFLLEKNNKWIIIKTIMVWIS